MIASNGNTGDGIVVLDHLRAGEGRGDDWRQVACLPAKIVKWVDGVWEAGRHE